MAAKLFKKKQRGFTLVELLIVIAVIGLLASTMNIAFVQGRVAARDNQRVANMRQMTNAVNFYLNDFGDYPTGNDDTGLAGFGIDFSNVGDDLVIGNYDFITELIASGYISESIYDANNPNWTLGYVWIKKTGNIMNAAWRNGACDNSDPEAALLFWLEGGKSNSYPPHNGNFFGFNAICLY